MDGVARRDRRRAGIDTDRAFTGLRGHARAQHLPLTDLARDVVIGRADLEPMLGATDLTTDPPSQPGRAVPAVA